MYWSDTLQRLGSLLARSIAERHYISIYPDETSVRVVITTFDDTYGEDTLSVRESMTRVDVTIEALEKALEKFDV